MAQAIGTPARLRILRSCQNGAALASWASILEAARVCARRPVIGLILADLRFSRAFPSRPNLVDRGTADGVGNAYSEAASRNELAVFSGRITPAGDFVRHVAAKLVGAEVVGAASDQFRRAEVQQVLEGEPDEIPWPWYWRRQGSGPTGSADCRAFQKAVFAREIKTLRGLLMPLALRSTVLKRDSNGNPSLHRGGSGARIDVLSATVLAFGAGCGFGRRFGIQHFTG